MSSEVPLPPNTSPEYVPLVHPESSLIKVPTAIVTRQRLVIDGLRYCFQVVDVAYPRLVGSLRALPRAEHTPQRFAPIFADAWSIVDAANRVRGLIVALGFDWASPAREAQYKAMLEPLVRIRNGSHHLEAKRLQQLEADRLPVWGRLSWVSVDDQTQVTVWNSMYSGVLPGEFADITGVIDLKEAPTWASEFDGRLELHAFGQTCRLATVVSELRGIVSDIECVLATIRKDHPATSPSDLYVRAVLPRWTPPPDETAGSPDVRPPTVK